MQDPLFLIGAGFNRDAKEEVGSVLLHSIYGDYQREFEYPSVADLLEICFEQDTLEEGTSIEERFSQALEEGDYKPIERLYETLMEADYRLIPELLPNGKNPNNCYARFLHRFKGSSFLTFNYDALLEALLHQRGQWYPHDGYGVPVGVDYEMWIDNTNDLGDDSSCLVLHLHGSLYVFTSEFNLIASPDRRFQEIKLKPKPDYFFDPCTMSMFFPRYRTPMVPAGGVPTKDRVIAPIPNKAEGLIQSFIQDVHARAVKLVSKTTEIIAIGYNFSPYDRDSYDHLFRQFSKRHGIQGVLITPSANHIRERLRMEYPVIEWQSVSMSFKSWVEAGFPKLE